MATIELSKPAAALAARFTKGALPGELIGFGEPEIADAARFIVDTAAMRAPGSAAIALEPISSDDVNRRMRLAIVNDDMPFLVDSIAAAIGAADLDIDRIIHPVVRVSRSPAGELMEIGGAGSPESIVYLELERADARERRTLVAALETVLADVRAAVEDWPKLQRAMAADEASIPSGEGAALLQWFLDGHFTQLGHQNWFRDGSGGDALGIARNEHETPILAEASRTLAIQWFEDAGANDIGCTIAAQIEPDRHGASRGAARSGDRARRHERQGGGIVHPRGASGPAPRSPPALPRCPFCAPGSLRSNRSSGSTPRAIPARR